MVDMVNAPPHYKEQSVMLEPIDILRWAPFDLGNALKYVIRAKKKGNELQDLQKAQYYIQKANESYGVNLEPYVNFLENYGLFLGKFENIPSYTGETFCYLRDFERKIKQLISEYNAN